MIDWRILITISIFLYAARDLLTKKAMYKSDPISFSFFVTLVAAAALFPFLAYSGLSVLASPIVLAALGISVLANIAAGYLGLMAIKISDISKILPIYASFSVVFVALITFVVLGEIPLEMKLLGIFAIIVGAYVVNLEKLSRKNMLSPLSSLIKEKGPKLALISALIISFAAIADKFAVGSLSPLAYSFLLFLSISIGFFIFSLLRKTKIMPQWRANRKLFVSNGILFAFASVSQMFAYSAANVSYVVPIKMLEIILVVLGGKIFFHEKHFANRLVGSLIMIAGAVLIFL